MIIEDYVSFEVAKLLKEKGFNWACNRVYQGPNLKFTTIPISPLMSLGELGGFHPKQLYVTNNELGDMVYIAPTQQIATKWLREKYNIYISIQPDFPSSKDYKMCWCWSASILHENSISIKRHQCYIETYEEAVEAGIKYCLENLI